MTALQQAAGHGSTLAALQPQLAALAAATDGLCAALGAGGAKEQPAALQLLKSQTELLQASAAVSGFPAASQLATLELQAAAAVAAVQRQQQEQGAAGGQQPGPEQRQQEWRQHYMARFADCFAAEVEALQEAEPPIPAGVLLQTVCLAADSDTLFPQPLRSLMLEAAAP